MSEFEKTELNTVHRSPARGAYDKKTVYGIVDAARICHVGFVEEGRPFVIPTIHARRGDEILLHGSKASRLLKQIEAGHEICMTMTLVDGLVLARSAFHHSMNYRSAVLFGRGKAIEDETEKRLALDCIVDTVVPGRADDARKANPKELDATLVAAIRIESASAKIRSGPPLDAKDDLDLPVWAGVLPLQERMLDPIPDAVLPAKVPLPAYLRNATRPED